MTSVIVCTTMVSRRRHRRLQVAAVAAFIVGIEFVRFTCKHCICQLAALPLSHLAVSSRLLCQGSMLTITAATRNPERVEAASSLRQRQAAYSCEKRFSCMAASCFLALALGTAALPPRGAHSWSRVLMLALQLQMWRRCRLNARTREPYCVRLAAT